jgi:hypothetical protein
MRVLLVQALSMDTPAPERVYPIGIVSLAGHLAAQGHTVSLLDMNMGVCPLSSW